MIESAVVSLSSKLSSFPLHALLIFGLVSGQIAYGASKDAESVTREVNAAVRNQLPFVDRQDFDDAKRGFMGALPDGVIKGSDDKVAWNLNEYGFLASDDVPATVNPSLWRQAQLNMNSGLFKVTDRIYQIRGFDIANMTIIEGETGLIIIDPLMTTDVARAGLELYYQHRPKKSVAAVIYTHTHPDHTGGVKGIVSEKDVQAGKVRVFAPAGFMEEMNGEFVLAGVGMSRRAHFQFGQLQPKGERGQVDAGLGKSLSHGLITLIPPTDLITKAMESRTVDGVEIVFVLTPGTEAPAEMIMYYPQLRALNMAEVATRQMHNIYPLRGAQIRDPNEWAKYLNKSLELFGENTDVLFAQHHWPTWGKERVNHFLKKQRDLYKFIHDQTVRLLNHGNTATEIAETLTLPESLGREWFSRPYYGTLSHNSVAVYNRYLGWYDANPANLNPLPPVSAARKFVEYMGGPQKVIALAREDFKKGEFRWVAQAINQLVFADPDNKEARELQADTLEQLGYQAESATWRNAYLQGAFELRNGVPKQTGMATASPDVIKALPLDMFFDYLGVRLNGPKAEGKQIVLNWEFIDTAQKYVLNLENAALTYVPNKNVPQADATLTLTRATLDAILLRETTFKAALANDAIKLQGNPEKLSELLGLLDEFSPAFNIVTP